MKRLNNLFSMPRDGEKSGLATLLLIICFGNTVANNLSWQKVSQPFKLDFGTAHGDLWCLEPILRLVNLQLQHQRCNRLERFYISEKYFF
jgi:hypothetical protein